MLDSKLFASQGTFVLQEGNKIVDVVGTDSQGFPCDRQLDALIVVEVDVATFLQWQSQITAASKRLFDFD